MGARSKPRQSAARTSATGSPKVSEDQLCAYPDDTEAETAQLQLAALIRTPPARVIRAVHLDDEPDAGRQEVSDELPADRGDGAKAALGALDYLIRSSAPAA